jgi:hypothetical protein
VAITTPVAVVTLSVSRSDACTPSGNSRRPVPSTSGWIISKYSSIRPAAISEPISTPLPMIARMPPDCALSTPTASAMPPRSSVELGHGRGCSRVVDATYLGELFSASLNGPPLSFQVLSRLS